MATFSERVNAIKAQQSAMQTAKQDAAIAQATDFWNRVDAIKNQQAASNGVLPSAAEVIRNSGNDPAAVALTQSPVYTTGLVDKVGNAVNKVSDLISGLDLTKPKATPKTGGHSAEEYYSSPVTPAQLDYLNAELASYYGMSKETAYQEALANTSYQRSVKDMQAAGLNPAVIYGAGKGSPADGVYSVKSASSGGGSGGSSRRSGGSSKSNDKLFDTGQYYGISAAAGLAAAVVTGNASNYYIGSTVAQSLMSAANSIFKK